jgi:hypothetical protein
MGSRFLLRDNFAHPSETVHHYDDVDFLDHDGVFGLGKSYLKDFDKYLDTYTFFL